MKPLYLIVISSILNLLLFPEAKSQQFSNDSAYVQHSSDNLLSNYKIEARQNLRLYSGREYIPNGQRANGFRFFGSDSSIAGSIYYDDNLYLNVKMRYDLVLDELVIEDYTNNNAIKLTKEKVDYFNMPNHFFVRIVPDKSFSAILSPGFYEQLRNEPVLVFAKHEKKLVFSSKAEEEAKYIEYIFYFIKIKNVFYKIESEHAILQAMKDEKDLMKKYIRENKISFKRNPEDALTKTAEYYSHLMN